MYAITGILSLLISLFLRVSDYEYPSFLLCCRWYNLFSSRFEARRLNAPEGFLSERWQARGKTWGLKSLKRSDRHTSKTLVNKDLCLNRSVLILISGRKSQTLCVSLKVVTRSLDVRLPPALIIPIEKRRLRVQRSLLAKSVSLCWATAGRWWCMSGATQASNPFNNRCTNIAVVVKKQVSGKLRNSVNSPHESANDVPAVLRVTFKTRERQL